MDNEQLMCINAKDIKIGHVVHYNDRRYSVYRCGHISIVGALHDLQLLNKSGMLIRMVDMSIYMHYAWTEIIESDLEICVYDDQTLEIEKE
jgi:hypothetical protein